MLLAVCHGTDGWIGVEDLASLSDLKVDPNNLLWAEADVRHLSADDVATIAEEFELHPLAVEDAVHARQRPKLEPYDTHLFIVFHHLYQENDQLEAAQIACFVGERYVVTLHAGAQHAIDEAKRRWERLPEDRKHPSFLMHTLIDVVVDEAQRLADALENEVEELEDIVLAAHNAPVQRQLYSVKQRTARLRRYVLPLQRVTSDVLSPLHEDRIPEETHALFRDVQDHVLRISDQVRNIDDLADAAIDLRRSAEAQMLNDATKRLSGWAAIIALPTLVTGIYGMNVGIWPPEGSRWGFYGILIFILVESVFLYSYFKKKDWI